MTCSCSTCGIQFLPTPNVEGETACHNCRSVPPVNAAPAPTTSIPPHRRRRRSSRSRSRTYSESQQQGIANMQQGGGIFAIGTVITFGTYMLAAESGGFYVVTWGAIIFGAVRFFMGLVQYNS